MLALAQFAGYFCRFVELHTTEGNLHDMVIVVRGVLLGFARRSESRLANCLTQAESPRTLPSPPLL